MTGSLCVSRVELLTPEVHLGRVGRIAGWRDVPFTFQLRNQSAVPTTCEVEELAAIDVRGTEQGAGGVLLLRLEAGETREVSAWLRTAQVTLPLYPYTPPPKNTESNSTTEDVVQDSSKYFSHLARPYTATDSAHAKKNEKAQNKLLNEL